MPPGTCHNSGARTHARALAPAGSKARGEEIEETHPLLIAMALKASAKSMPAGFTLDRQWLDDSIRKHNEKRSGAAHLGREKKEAVISLCLAMPGAVYDLFLENYREYTYEKGYANAFIHSHPAWKDSAKDPAAKGGWVDVYTNTPGAAVDLCKDEMRLFKDRFPIWGHQRRPGHHDQILAEVV